MAGTPKPTGLKTDNRVARVNCSPTVQTLRAIADHLEAGGFKHLSGGISIKSSENMLVVFSDLALMYLKPIES